MAGGSLRRSTLNTAASHLAGQLFSFPSRRHGAGGLISWSDSIISCVCCSMELIKTSEYVDEEVSSAARLSRAIAESSIVNKLSNLRE